MERLTNRDKEIPLPNADNALFWARVHEKLARYEDAEERKPQTNADRIRAMTDKELAEFLLNRDLDIVEKASKSVGFTYKVDREPCLVNVIDWLKQEVIE